MLPGSHLAGSAGGPSPPHPATQRASQDGLKKPRTHGIPADHMNGDAVHQSDINASALEVADSLDAQADALFDEDNILGGIELAAKALQLRCSVIASSSSSPPSAASPEKQNSRSNRKNTSTSVDGYSARGSVEQEELSGAVQAAFAAAEKIVLRCNVTAMERLRNDNNDTVAFSLLSYAHQLTETGKGPLHANPEAHTSLKATTLNNLGCLHQRRGDDATALSLIRSAAEAAPDSAVTLINLSALQNKMGFPVEAARNAREAVRVIDESNSPRSTKSKAATSNRSNAAAPMALSSVYQSGRRSSMTNNSHSLALWRAAGYHNLAMALETLDTNACVNTYEHAALIALENFGAQDAVSQQIIDDMLRYAELHGITRLLAKYGSVRGGNSTIVSTPNAQQKRDAAPTPSHSQSHNNNNNFQMNHPVIVLQAQKPAPDVRRRPSTSARINAMTGTTAAPPPLRARKQFLAPMSSSRNASPNSSAQSTPRAISKRGGHAATYSGLRVPPATERKIKKIEPISPRKAGAGGASAAASLPGGRGVGGGGLLPPMERGGARVNLHPLPPSSSSSREKPSNASRVREDKVPSSSSANGIAKRNEKPGVSATRDASGDRSATGHPSKTKSTMGESDSTLSSRKQESRTGSEKKEPKKTQRRNSTPQRAASTPRKPMRSETAAAAAGKDASENHMSGHASHQQQQQRSTTEKKALNERTTGAKNAAPRPEKGSEVSPSTATHAKTNTALTTATGTTTNNSTLTGASGAAAAKKGAKSTGEDSTTSPNPTVGKATKERELGGNESRGKKVSLTNKGASEPEKKGASNVAKETAATGTSRNQGMGGGGMDDIVHALVERLRMLIDDEEEYCRQSVYAERIQRSVRCHQARKELQRRKDERKAKATLAVLRTHIAAIIAQRAFRAYLQREKTHKERSRLAAQRADIENYSATTIQSSARRWLARRELRRRRQFSARVTRAASILQRWFRVCLARKRARELRSAHARDEAELLVHEKQELASLVIQRAWRAHYSRKSTRRNRSALRDKRRRLDDMRRHAGSLAIQRVWRGRRARQRCSVYQSHVRLYRGKLEKLERRDGAALRIQSWYRMLREERRHRDARGDLRRARLLAEEEQSPRRLAAKCIQRAARQFLARAHLRKLKDSQSEKKNARRGERFVRLWQRMGRGCLARGSVRAAFRNKISQGLLHASELDHIALLEDHSRGVTVLCNAHRVGAQEASARGDVAGHEENARNALGKIGLSDLEKLLQIEREAKKRSYEEENGVARSQWKQRKKFWMDMLPARMDVQAKLLKEHYAGCESVVQQWMREKDTLELNALDAEWEAQIRAAQDEERALLEEVLAANRETRKKEREAENVRHAQRLHISEQRALFRGKMLLTAKRLGSIDSGVIQGMNDGNDADLRNREGVMGKLAASYTPSDSDWSYRISRRYERDAKVRDAAVLVTRVGRGFVGRLVFRIYKGIMASYNEERVSSEASPPPIPYLLDNVNRHSAASVPRRLQEEVCDFTELPQQVHVLVIDTPPVDPADLEKLIDMPPQDRRSRRAPKEAAPAVSWSFGSVDSEHSRPCTASPASDGHAAEEVEEVERETSPSDDRRKQCAAERIRCFLQYLPSSKREVNARQSAVRKHLEAVHEETEKIHQRDEQEEKERNAERKAQEEEEKEEQQRKQELLSQAARKDRACETLSGFASIIHSRQHISEKQAAIQAYLQEEHAKMVISCFSRSCLSRAEAADRKARIEQHLSTMALQDASAVRVQCAYRQHAARRELALRSAEAAQQLEIEHQVNEVLHESACTIQRGFRSYYARRLAEERRTARRSAYERLAALAAADGGEEEEGDEDDDDTYGTESGDFTSATSITYDESSMTSGMRNSSTAYSSPSRGNSAGVFHRKGSAGKTVKEDDEDGDDEEAKRNYWATMLSVSEEGKSAMAGLSAEEALHCARMLQESARVIQQSARRWLAKRKLSNLRHIRQEHLASLRASSIHNANNNGEYDDDVDGESSTTGYMLRGQNVDNETTEDAQSTGDYYGSSTHDDTATGADDEYLEEGEEEEEVGDVSNEFEDDEDDEYDEL